MEVGRTQVIKEMTATVFRDRAAASLSRQWAVFTDTLCSCQK